MLCAQPFSIRSGLRLTRGLAALPVEIQIVTMLLLSNWVTQYYINDYVEDIKLLFYAIIKSISKLLGHPIHSFIIASSYEIASIFYNSGILSELF